MLKVIRSEAAHRTALDRVYALFDAAPGSPEADELDVLAVLVGDYESKHHRIRRPTAIESFAYAVERTGADASNVDQWTPLDALRWALERRTSRKDLEPLIGGDGRVSEVLSGKRGLSIEMIRRLHVGLDIPLEILMRESKKPASRTKKPARSSKRKRAA
jgi:HTH-type transcriptional regulator/antitoxin HigA